MGQWPPEPSPDPLGRQQRLDERPLRIGQRDTSASHHDQPSDDYDRACGDHEADTPLQINFPDTFVPSDHPKVYQCTCICTYVSRIVSSVDERTWKVREGGGRR